MFGMHLGMRDMLHLGGVRWACAWARRGSSFFSVARNAILEISEHFFTGSFQEWDLDIQEHCR